MNLIEKIKSEISPIIIFGAGIVGEVLNEACQESNMNIKCFCDNNINKTKKLLLGKPVVHVPDLKKKYPDAIFLISAADLKDVKNQLNTMGYSKWYAASSFLKDFSLYNHEFSAPSNFVEYAVQTAILCQDSYLNPDKLFLRSVDIITTEKCSLKCRDCSNLMRYYKNPKDCDIKEINKEVDKLCSIVDEINEFRVLGGEPFMNKNSHLIIKELNEKPNAKKVVIYTNGTIVPKKEQIEYMKSKKLMFIITDYGKYSRNLDKLTKVLEENNIDYFTDKVGGWTDCAKIIKHNRDINGQKEIFRDCCAKNTITLSKGKLYRCPFSANADRLKAIPDFKGDYVDIFENIDINDMKKNIRRFLLDKDFLEACDYCNGRSFGDPEIEPAIQADKPLDYKVYER